jgi:predicted DNA-binding transcriptional regulator AlpA
MQCPDHRRLLSRLDVEIRYGITKRFLEAAACRGDGPRYVRVGRLVRYRASDIDAWIEAHASDTGPSR